MVSSGTRGYSTCNLTSARDQGLSNPTVTGDASAASDANATTEAATTEGESAANTEASSNEIDPKTGKFAPKSSRSLLNLQGNQADEGMFQTTWSLGRAAKNLVTGATSQR